MAVIPFADWRPDMPALGKWARDARNVVPAEESYRPMNGLAGVSNALSARAQGAAWFRGVAGGTMMFAGDATKLYKLGNATWSDVSRLSGGPYSVGADGMWRFVQFGSLAIAANGVDTMQKFDLAAGANWQALGGTPPIGTYLAVVAENFLLTGKIGANPQRVQWCGFRNPETWGSSATTQADYQDIADGGNVTGLAGGEVGRIYQESAIRRMVYQGPDTIFRIDKIATDIGCSIPGSLASLIGMDFFLHKSGFYMVRDGQTVVPIGRGKVDRTFWRDFDETNQHRCSAAIDPVRGLYFFAFPANGSNGMPNRLFIYNWVREAWTYAAVDCEMIFGGVSQKSYSLEELDAFGTVDTLPYSLDSSYWSGVLSLLLFAFDTSHKSGSFSGNTLEATVETAEFAPLEGKRAVVRGCRPLIDGGTPLVAVGARETQQGAVAYGPEAGLTPAGLAPLYTSGRYFRVRARMPAGSSWSNMQGIDDLDARPSGAQ